MLCRTENLRNFNGSIFGQMKGRIKQKACTIGMEDTKMILLKNLTNFLLHCGLPTKWSLEFFRGVLF